ncbi:Peptidase family S58 [Corynebacterium atrinae]|uniref:P1 family peptidase n=1 Tax=Corynebacterium atrinae TaxID=1336740 RepID=UPI0025B61CDD|nr:P1 family peptidase [Corynebacterium atrinae]WJY64196.1 Peptidase family S58 [Corynebacterium atrinae]
MTSASLIDVPGVRLGHASLGDTGVTVVMAGSEGMIAAVDVRGGGPGTRETDLLAPHNTVDRVHAIALCGGSAFGLAAADGVMSELERVGIGFPVRGEGLPGPRVPIVPAAVIFDLFVGDAAHRPTAPDGAAATRAALEGPGDGGGVGASASIGAGCGATAGVLRGGFGQASVAVGEYVVAAGVVANPVGSVIDPQTGRLYGDPRLPAVDLGRFLGLEHPAAKLNTTIGVIATDAPVSTAQAKRLAMVGHDGIARAVRPAHSPLDGDTLFAVSTAPVPGSIDTATLGELCRAAADVVEAAIVAAIINAAPGYGLETYAALIAATR